MHGYRPAQGPQRTRVLYLFRSPSHLRMGRRPLDEEAREALEHTHPDLSFDWTVLGRETETVRSDDREREGPRVRRSGGATRGTRPASPTPVVVDDETLLGRTLGGETALRLRTRYNELLERIVRRARTPEDRDRLTAALQRLNPDDWADARAITAQAATVEEQWDAIAAELPSRRRGRRGGRRREAATTDSGESIEAAPSADPDEASAIMAANGEVDVPQQDLDATDPGRAGGAGADTGGDGAVADGATEHDVPRDDEFRSH
jgi:hypothetical protein